MRISFSDEAVVLKKTKLQESTSSLVLFSKNHGKMRVSAYGVRTLTSRRLSHLETGNFIKFSYT
ncbi:MAG: recombination protein O N-terminal domain-containing protein, partial [Candidatus Roizmanbacteria bacterium]